MRNIQVTPGAATLLALLAAHGALSRTDLAKHSGLTQGAVTKALRPLLDEGYVHELATEPGRVRAVGRPSTPIELRADREDVLGIKLTDDTAIGVLTDLRAEVRHSAELPLPSPDVPEVVGVVARLARILLERRDSEGIPVAGDRARRLGLAVSGDVDRTRGLVRYSPFLRWRDVPLADLVAAATGLSVTVENDVKSLACKELLTGAGAGLRSFAVVTIGAGIGCSLVVEGTLVAGAFGVAGELGHLVVDRAGPACHCGSRGCVEATASTAAIEHALASATGTQGLSVLDGARLAADGDEAAARCLTDAGDAIGTALAAVANLFGPQRIVVTGEGLDAGPLIPAAARERFQRQAFATAARCELEFRPMPLLGWAAGAAAVAVQNAFRPTNRTASSSTVRTRRSDEALQVRQAVQ
ncbi:ROK family protein [Actinopolymorpha alba]|uniref:ROK family protein n=1 Tax=Actinopolymorpha alba TaxID=533267 RepID=UPI0007C84549|nr:ROK family protein [Actinopolymorpha alba]